MASSRNKREGKFIGYTCRCCEVRKTKKPLVWFIYYCRGPAGQDVLNMLKARNS